MREINRAIEDWDLASRMLREITEGAPSQVPLGRKERRAAERKAAKAAKQARKKVPA